MPSADLKDRGTVKAVAILVVVAALSVWELAGLAKDRELSAMISAGDHRLELYSGTVASALEKYSYLPTVLARDKDIRAMLAAPRDLGQIDRVNGNLVAINQEAKSGVLYVLNADGLTLASSNWQDPGSFIGNSYAFRPYFLQTLAGGDGRYFGVGVTTRTPGYFIAKAALEGGKVAGVVVAKVDLDELQKDWAGGGEMVLVTDSHQVTIMASRVEWRYGTLGDPDPKAAAEIEQSQQYAGLPLPKLDFREVEVVSPEQSVVVHDGRRYLMQSRRLGNDGWVIRYLSDLEPVARRGRDVGLMTTVVAAALSLLALYLRQRRLRLRAEAEARSAVAAATLAARDSLERMVGERTAELRETQEELVHAGKMAALGQMSAALAHEINQPLAAIQTFLASTQVFAERGDQATVRSNLNMIGDLVRRMATITAHLKTFARKAPVKREVVSLSSVIDGALVLVEPGLRQSRITLSRDVPPEAQVMGDANRLEQVLVNLIRNAADAMADSPRRSLEIRTEEIDADWAIVITDSGQGIEPEHMGKLFDPFFTTKEVGQGLGLGLSLSYGIIRSFGGTIRAENNLAGGASFIVQLPKAIRHG